MNVKSALSSAAVLLAGAAALTACQPGSTTAVSGSTPTKPATASSTPSGTDSGTKAPVSPSASSSTPARGTGSSGSKGASGSGGSGASGGSSHTGSSSGGTGGGSGSGGYATSDSYAFKHPCTSTQVSVHVVRRSSAPTQRVIEVRNLGARSCGLSYYPLVVLYNGEAANGGVTVKPLVPSGLGGAPASPVYAGRTAYAVIDLDPSGATTGTAQGVDEINVLADGDHMPNADTLSFPLGSGARVLKPKLGLYEDTIVDAVSSMKSADILP